MSDNQSLDDNKYLGEQMTLVRLDIRELMTKIDSLKDLNIKVDLVSKVADAAMASTNVAHKRLNSIDRIIFWTATTFFGSIIIAAAVFITKGGLVK